MHETIIKFALSPVLALSCLFAIAQTNSLVCAEAACPAAIAPAYRDFKAKCEAGKASRGDLIALKKFIAASALDGATKTNLTREVRKMYQRGRLRGEGEGER